MKTIASRTHQAVALLKQEAIWFLTATPMWNRPLDFGAYSSLFEANLASPEGLANSTDPDIDPSSTASTFASYTQWSAKNPLPTTGLPYHLLSVVQFTSLGQGGHLTTEMGFNTLPIIRRMTTLAREPGFTMAGNNLDTITIGADIPTLATTTVKLPRLGTTTVFLATYNCGAMGLSDASRSRDLSCRYHGLLQQHPLHPTLDGPAVERFY